MHREEFRKASNTATERRENIKVKSYCSLVASKKTESEAFSNLG